MEHKESTKVFVDNQAAIAIFHNSVFYGKIKHFKIKLFFSRDRKMELLFLFIAKLKTRLQICLPSHFEPTSLNS